MSINAGESIPDVQVKSVTADGVNDVSAADFLGEGTVVLFTVPGAFTPTCHLNHLPGYLDQAAALRAAGVDRIVCATANDHHVVKAWGEATGALGTLEFIADSPAALAQALGIDRDLSQGGLGLRYVRAALVIRNGKVETLRLESSPGEVAASSADEVLAYLREKAA